MLRCWIKCGGVFFLIFIVRQHFFLIMNFTLMTVLYIIAALLELAPQFVSEFIMQWENCMVRNIVIAAMFQFHIRTVQFRKYLKNKSSDLGILTVLEILGRKKKSKLFFFFFSWTWQSGRQRGNVSSLNFRAGGFGCWGEQRKRQCFFLTCSVFDFLK